MFSHEGGGCWDGGADWERQPHVQGVIVLCQGVEAVVQDEVLKRGVDVVRLSKAKAMWRAVDHAVLHFFVHAEKEGNTE